ILGVNSQGDDLPIDIRKDRPKDYHLLTTRLQRQREIYSSRLVLSCGTGIYQGYSRSKQISSKQFLIADGRMKIIPTVMSLLATLKSPASLLGMPVEFYY
ncbi:unnamed protein product, partial [Adineta steineri]